MSTPAAPQTSPWAARRCPDCAAPLDGGPIRYHCWSCARSWYAADLDYEILYAAA